MKLHTPRGPGCLSALRRGIIVAGILCAGVGAATLGSPLTHTAYAACVQPGNITNDSATAAFTSGSVTINVDGGSVSFSANGSMNPSHQQLTAFSCGSAGIFTGSGTGTISGNPTTVGTCVVNNNVFPTLFAPKLTVAPDGTDTLTIFLNCSKAGNIQVLAQAITGEGVATPEAPSSVLFGGGVALLLLGFGYRSRRRKVARG